MVVIYLYYVYIYIYIRSVKWNSTADFSGCTQRNSTKLGQYRGPMSTNPQKYFGPICPPWTPLFQHVKKPTFRWYSVLAATFRFGALRWILLSLFFIFWSPLWPCQATNTVEDKMLGANGFWLIKHSIWEQFSWFLLCIYSFYTQKWGTKNLSKIGHSCQVP